MPARGRPKKKPSKNVAPTANKNESNKSTGGRLLHKHPRAVSDTSKSLKKKNKRQKLSSDNDNVQYTNISMHSRTADTSAIPFSELTEEILVKIFTYLGHGDLLSSRLVNKTWNNTISNFQNFSTTKMVYYIKAGGALTDSQETLNKSKVPWNRLRVENSKFLKGIEQEWFTLPPWLSPIVKSLELVKWDVSWDKYCETILQFKTLEKLSMVQCKIKTMKQEIKQESVTESLENLKSLSMKGNIPNIIFLLNQLNLLNVSHLRNISFTQIVHGGTLITKADTLPNATKLLSAILKLIQNSSPALKSLRINFESLHLIDNFFPKVLEKLIELVDLESFNVKCFSNSDPNKMERDMDIFCRFIKSQKNLKQVYLPKTRDAKAETWASVMTAVNEDITQICVRSSRYIDSNFLDNFSKLSTLTYEFKLERILKECEQKSYPLMKTLRVQDNCDVQLISLRFTNLTKLTLGFDARSNWYDGYNFQDSDLQAIIQNLKKLKYLYLGYCDKITDSGVTGLKEKYCQKILNSLKDDKDKNRSIIESAPLKETDGSPISSLKGLIHLTILNASSITDVGIFYGFQFKELRHLLMKHVENVTKYGWKWLAQRNPDLDLVHLKYGKPISPEHIQNLKSYFRRIKRKNFVYEYDEELKEYGFGHNCCVSRMNRLRR